MRLDDPNFKATLSWKKRQIEHTDEWAVTVFWDDREELTKIFNTEADADRYIEADCAGRGHDATK